MQFATHFGGSGGELLRDMTADAQGNIYVAGTSGSADIPVTPSDLPGQSKKDGAMVAKFSADGKLIWSRHCGSDKDYFYSVKVDRAGCVFVAGRMGPGYSTYIGGSGDDMARACFVGADGTLYAGGVTTSRDFPVKDAYQAKYGGDPGYGSVPNNGKFPAGWGNGDCWLAKLRHLTNTGESTPAAGK